MTPTTVTSSARSRQVLAAALRRIRKRVEQLGLRMSMWDTQLQPIAEMSPCSEFCRMACASPAGVCRKVARDVAHEAIEEGWSVSRGTDCGCAVVALPVWQRRRLIGAAVACYPTLDVLDEETLARFCTRMQLDRTVMMQAARRDCRYWVAQADHLKMVLDWLLQDAQALDVSQHELGTLSTNLSNTYEELSLVYNISGSVRVTQSPRAFLQRACEEILEVMDPDCVLAVVAAGEPAERDGMVVRAGRMLLSDEAAEALVSSRITRRLDESPAAYIDNHAGGPSDGVHSMVVVPMLSEGNVLGVLLALNDSDQEFDSVDLKLMSSVGSQAAVFLQNSRLYDDLQDLLMGVLHALTASIDAKDPYTCGHSMRVALISQRLAEQMGLDNDRVRRLYLAGLLHDVGKIGIPEAILCKPGRLTEDEYEVIKGHPMIGARILTGIRKLDDVTGGIITHHERLDGQGYPQGLADEDLPLEGRIIGLADAFDALTSDRTYRKALTLEQAVAEIRRCTGTQFDPEAARVFLAMDLPAFMAEIHRAPAHPGKDGADSQERENESRH